MRRKCNSIVRLILAGAAVLWASALPLAAYVASRSEAGASASNLFALAVYEIGSIICHQRPERSFHLGSVPLPVCARCTGIYLGAAVAALIATARLSAQRKLAPGERQRVEGPDRPAVTTARVVLIAASIPAVLTLVYEWTSGRPPANDVRAITGGVVGAGVAWVLLRLE